MKIRIIFFVSFYFLISFSYGQSLDLNKKSLEKIINFEKVNYGTFKDSIDSFGILVDPIRDIFTLKQTKVIIFRREKDDFEPQLHIWYHFDLNNKEHACTKYNWGLYNPSFNLIKQKGLVEKLSKSETKFQLKYEELKKELAKMFGEPTLLKEIVDNERAFIEAIYWEEKDKIIGLSIDFDRKLSKFSNYQIEVTVTYK
jgi:hypothetical protein